MDDRKSMQIIRVTFSGGFNHPERPNLNAKPYNFVAYASLKDGALVVTWRAMDLDNNYSLKTTFSHRVGICHGAVEKLPWGKKLLRAAEAGQITPNIESEVLLAHFSLLIDMEREGGQECKFFDSDNRPNIH